jgi:hypothetical protein
MVAKSLLFLWTPACTPDNFNPGRRLELLGGRATCMHRIPQTGVDGAIFARPFPPIGYALGCAP